MIITGTYNLEVDTAWRNVQEQDVYLECDTTDAPVIINLFPIADLNRFWGVKLYISDISSNAKNHNITINTGFIGDPPVYDSVDETGNNQIVLNENGESVIFQVVYNNLWNATESSTLTQIPNLQSVTNEGNSTDQDIQLLDSASYNLSNNSKIANGSKDNYELGGGISQVCTLEKEIQWENGVQYYFVQGEPIIHANSINDNIPDNTYDITKSFQVGSTYTVLNTGLTYICLDNTIGNAVWSVKSLTLQDILDYNHELTNGNNFQGTDAGSGNGGSNINAFGENSARNNEGISVNAFGKDSSKDNTGSAINSLGENSATSNSGDNVNAFGENSANGNQGSNVNSLGKNSCQNNLGSSVNAFGESSANANTGNQVIGLGENSARENSGDNVVAIGQNAGQSNSFNNVFIIANTELPIFLNYLTASTTITVANGASSGCTYLYYDETLNVVGAVRL